MRIVLLDYRKAFDLIDHRILVQKISSLQIPLGVARWVCDFLMDCKQRVKLANDCFSEWGRVPSGVSLGTKLGPWLFLLMINDLRVPNVNSWKYVDDTTVAEVVENGNHSIIQSAAVAALDWLCKNKLQLNVDKCLEMVIDFKKQKHSFDSISRDRKELDTVNNVKILGLTISNNLLWNDHINNIVKKTNKRLYFIVLLKRAQVPLKDIMMFYCTCIRPVLEYCTPVFNHALPK